MWHSWESVVHHWSSHHHWVGEVEMVMHSWEVVWEVSMAVLVVELHEHVVWLLLLVVVVSSVVSAFVVELLKWETEEAILVHEIGWSNWSDWGNNSWWGNGLVLEDTVEEAILFLKVRLGYWSNWGNWCWSSDWLSHKVRVSGTHSVKYVFKIKLYVCSL